VTETAGHPKLEASGRRADCRQICDSKSLKLQRIATAFNERPTTDSTSITYEPWISIGFNKVWNLVRDQGVEGSNPLSPTNYFLSGLET
jgi:hypothetical protein